MAEDYAMGWAATVALEAGYNFLHLEGDSLSLIQALIDERLDNFFWAYRLAMLDVFLLVVLFGKRRSFVEIVTV